VKEPAATREDGGSGARRVTVAVVDSGAHVPHPHLPAEAVAGGTALRPDGSTLDDWVDRLGHGTAAAAAIHERAPDARLWVIKVFEMELATDVPTLVRAIDWASEREITLVNLSLGTRNKLREPELAPAVERAVEAGTIIVSAHEHEDRLWYPGSMPGVVGVVADTSQPRESASVVELPRGAALRTSPFPRPIPGVPPERNMHGISFAVANATGILARLLADHPEVRTSGEALRLVRSGARE
jgi:subtilisin family serine protease